MHINIGDKIKDSVWEEGGDDEVVGFCCFFFLLCFFLLMNSGSARSRIENSKFSWEGALISCHSQGCLVG